VLTRLLTHVSPASRMDGAVSPSAEPGIDAEEDNSEAKVSLRLEPYWPTDTPGHSPMSMIVAQTRQSSNRHSYTQILQTDLTLLSDDRTFC
jgi:hypothetical protein